MLELPVLHGAITGQIRPAFPTAQTMPSQRACVRNVVQRGKACFAEDTASPM
jgi:hypothetical protein